MKGMGLKKGLSLVLCGVMLVIGLGLSDFGSLKSYADDPALSGVSLTLSQTPVSGQSAAFSCNVSVPSGCHYAARIDSTVVGENEGFWYNNTDRKKLGAGDIFLGGKLYRTAVLVTADEGYYFSKPLNGISVSADGADGTSVPYGIISYADDHNDKIKSFEAFLVFRCAEKKITITYNKGTGSDEAAGTQMPQEDVDEGPFFYKACKFTPPANERFKGWAVGNPDATPLLKDGDDPIDLRSDTTLYAKYEPIPQYVLTVICDPYKGSVVASDSFGHPLDLNAVPEETNVVLTAQPGSGWLVDGWHCGVESITSADMRTYSFKMPAGPMDVTLRFKKDSEAKTITLDAGGGSVSPSEVMTNKAGQLKLPNGNLITLPTPTAAGKVFKYWATSPDGSEYNPSATYLEDTRLYAVYEDSLDPDSASDSNNNKPTPYELATELIDTAKAGDTVTYDFGDWHSLPLGFMEKVASRPDLTYVFKCVYQSEHYEFTINLGTKFELDCLWYGPLKMAELFNTKITDESGNVKSVNGAQITGNGVYLIQSGDTLSMLAARFKRTIEELLILNSDITDSDSIVAGKILQY